MPTIRPRTVVDEEYVSQTSYTIDLDLPTKGVFSTMWLMVHARTLGASAHANEPFMKYLISSISMNQAGQEALNAARPQAFEASYYYKTGKMPKLGYRQFTANIEDIEEVVPILLGDKVDDLEHTVDLSKLSDPKLSVTYDLETTGLQDRDLWDTTYYPRFSVLMDLIEGAAPASKGYYSLRQIEQYDVTDDLIKLTELKGGRPIKRLLPEYVVSTADYEWRNSLDLVRIHGDNEAYVPFRMTPDRWANLVREKFGLCEAVAKVYRMEGDRWTDCVVAERESYNAEPLEDTDHFGWFHGGSGLKSNFNLIKFSDGTKGEHIHQPSFLRYVGVLPWNIQVVDMPKMLDMDHLDPTLHAPVYLELDFDSTAATYCDSIRVNIEDLVA